MVSLLGWLSPMSQQLLHSMYSLAAEAKCDLVRPGWVFPGVALQPRPDCEELSLQVTALCAGCPSENLDIVTARNNYSCFFSLF